MDRAKQYNIAVALLAIAVLVTGIGWIHSHRAFNAYKSDAATAQYQENLSVCESTDPHYDQLTCVNRLSDLSNLLSVYESKMKGAQAQPK